MTPGNEYGDFSCVMGTFGISTCFNAPQMYRLGWGGPLYFLNISVDSIKSQKFLIKSTLSGFNSSLQIVNGDVSYFASLRIRSYFDAIPEKFDKQISIHSLNGTRYDVSHPVLLGILSVNMTFMLQCGIQLSYLSYFQNETALLFVTNNQTF